MSGHIDGNKCTWSASKTEEAMPHVSVPWKAEPKICDTILEHVGNTPLVRINKITSAEGIECELLAKCEFFNAAGSVKDRPALRMVLDAEAQGRIKPGDTLIEPTSGNMGLGLALAAAVRGYRMIVTMPEKMSQEKVDVLKALGAEIVRTPTEAASASPDSHIGVALRLQKEIPNAHILDQYVNPSNPVAHYETTAEEILAACDGKVDAIVCGAGTGGTITGIARKFKEKVPDCLIVGVDPWGSILAQPESLNETDVTSYQVEGTGYDFIPKVLDRTIVDEWIKSGDKDALLMARRLIKEEGLLCGGSSGAAVHAALQVCKKLGKGKRVVVVLPDSVRNYMTKFLSVDWMVEHGFMEEERKEAGTENALLSKHTVKDLKLSPPVTIEPTVSCKECVDLLSAKGFDQLPVVSSSGEVVGMVTLGNLTAQLVSGKVKATDAISKAVYKQFRAVSPDTPLDRVSRIFDRDHFVLVTASQSSIGSGGAESERSVVFGVATRIDLLNFLMSKSE